MKPIIALTASLLLVACAAPTPDQANVQQAGAPNVMLASSAECLAANLSPAEPFAATAIPNDVLQKRQNGWVALRYDVIAGKAENVSVAASKPEGLYDRYALQHTMRYRDAGGKTVRGCVMTIDVKF